MKGPLEEKKPTKFLINLYSPRKFKKEKKKEIDSSVAIACLRASSTLTQSGGQQNKRHK